MLLYSISRISSHHFTCEVVCREAEPTKNKLEITGCFHVEILRIRETMYIYIHPYIYIYSYIDIYIYIHSAVE